MKKLPIIFTVLLLIGATGTLVAQPDSLKALQAYDRYWEMQPGIYRVSKNGQTGVITTTGKVVVPVQFDQVWSPDNNAYIRVLKDAKTGLYHVERGIILPAEYDQIWGFENGLAKVMKERKFGFVNKQGLLVIPCQYQHIWSLENGRFKVMKDGLTGYLATDGSTIVPPVYQQIWAYSDGLARVLREGKMGFIDEEGNEVIPAVYDQVWPFDGGKARVLKDGHQLFINKKGHLLYVLDDTSNELPRDATELELAGSDTARTDAAGTRTSTSRIRIQRDYIEIGPKSEHTKRTKRSSRRHTFNGHLAGAGLAMNSYLNSDGKEQLPPGYEFMELNQGKSLEVSIYPVQESIQLLGGWFGLTGGLGVQYNNYRFNLDSYSDISEAGRPWFPEVSETASITKSKITTLYLNMPLLAEIQIKNRHNRQPLYISGGVVGGVKLQSHTKLVYHDDLGRHKRKRRDDMGIPSFRYGFMARAGYGDFSLYGTYYPVSLFKTNRGPELYPFSLGVMYLF